MEVNYELKPGRKLIKTEYEPKSNNPQISIITPYYNDSKYIQTTVNSVLNQTYPYFEWIIVDDGSTNKEDIEKLKEIESLDERIKVFHKSNEGPAAARDFGASKANNLSKYLVFLDSDDLIINTYLECAYWTLETNKKAAWAYTDTVNFGGENFIWSKWYNPKKELDDNILVMTAMIRKEAFWEVNGFEIRDKNVYEDWCLWLKMISKQMFPVRMNLLGFWYRKKSLEESHLKQSNTHNKEKAMQYVKNITEKIEKNVKEKITKLENAIQYPQENYNWEEIVEEQENIVIPKKKKDQKTNILLIIPWMNVGGADKFNLDIIKRSNKEKYNFIILTTEPSSNPWRQEFEEHATVYDLTTFLNRKDWISFINYIINKENINLIFNTNSTFGYSAIPYLKVKYPTIPVIDYVHMEEWYNRNGGFSRDSSTIASFIDHTYVCNGNSEKILVNYFKRNEKEVSTVYIGVDEKIYNPQNFNKQEILNQLKINPNGKYIISYICRISEQKRPYLLLQIIKKLKMQREDFIFVIAGDGPLLEKVKNKAKKLNIYNNMIFLGNVKETEKVYAISDMTINCSIKEGLALTAYESLAMGVPVLSSDVGGQKELINNNVGVIVPCMQNEEDIFNYNYSAEEVEPYVKGINQILNNLNNYKKEARNRILNGFTIDNMVENMDVEFQKIIQHPNQEKEKNAKNMVNNIDLCKEFITRYLIGASEEYKWLAQKYVQENIDIDIKYEENYGVLYENTLGYKIKHPIYVVLTKMGIYNFLKRALKRGEK